MIRPDKQPIRVYLFRNGNLSPGTKFYRLDEGRKFKVIVYIFLEYVIGCSIDYWVKLCPLFPKRMYLCNCSFELLHVMVTICL